MKSQRRRRMSEGYFSAVRSTATEAEDKFLSNVDGSCSLTEVSVLHLMLNE